MESSSRMASVIFIAAVAALAECLTPLKHCGVAFDLGQMRAHGALSGEVAFTGTEQQLECVERVLKQGTGDDPIPLKGGDASDGRSNSLAQRYGVLTGAAHPTNAAPAEPAEGDLGRPTWYMRCWSTGKWSDVVDAHWGERTWEYFIWGLACDATYCYGLSRDSYDETSPMLKQYRFDRAKCATIIVTEVVPGGPQPPLGYPVRFVIR
jgi:hypothetical protein